MVLGILLLALGIIEGAAQLTKVAMTNTHMEWNYYFYMLVAFINMTFGAIIIRQELIRLASKKELTFIGEERAEKT